MREILFRGKDSSGSWHYGAPVIYSDELVFIEKPYIKSRVVDPDTVGQFTGLTDKNGKKIFEGDILRVERFIYHGEKDKRKEITVGIVFYDTEGGRFGYCSKGHYKCLSIQRLFDDETEEVVGNIFDNPELLKGVPK